MGRKLSYILLVILASAVITSEDQLVINSDLTVEKYLESSKKDFSVDESTLILSNPSGTKVVLTSNEYRDADTVIITPGTNINVIGIEGVDTPGTIPASNYQATAIDDVSNTAGDTVFTSIFLSDNELVTEFTTSAAPVAYVNVLDIEEPSLAVSKKSPEVTVTHPPEYTVQTTVSADYKNGLVVIGEKSFVIIDSMNILSSKLFTLNPMTPETYFSLNFDKRETSSWIVASITTGVKIFDHSIGKDGEDPSRMEIYQDSDLALCFTDFEQNYQDMSKAAVALRREIEAGTWFAQVDEKGVIMYFDIQDPFSNGFIVLAKSPEELSDYESVSNSLKNIIETNYFLTAMSTGMNPTINYLYLIDTSIAGSSVGVEFELPVYRVNKAVKYFLPTDVKFPMISSFTRLIEGQNKFAFSVIHGGSQIGNADQDKGTFFVLNFKKNCHETCLTCDQTHNPEKCLSCAEGRVLKEMGVSGSGKATGACIEEDGENEGSESSGDGDGEISLKFPTVALCGANPIRGCSQCSNFHVGKCATCSNQLGLAGYTDDFSAGEKCVDCPIQGCMKCEQGPEDSERKCSRCLGDKSLLRLANGQQVCFGHMWGLASQIILWMLIFNL